MSLIIFSLCGAVHWPQHETARRQCSASVLFRSISFITPCIACTWSTPQSMDHPAISWQIQRLSPCSAGRLDKGRRVLQPNCRIGHIYICYALHTSTYCPLPQLTNLSHCSPWPFPKDRTYSEVLGCQESGWYSRARREKSMSLIFADSINIFC